MGGREEAGEEANRKEECEEKGWLAGWRERQREDDSSLTLEILTKHHFLAPQIVAKGREELRV